ncbi:MAG TPA: hypothetical protein DCP28_10860, partial [Cytophagales bacterium]|nr:hypothetical protein [Cytophagales bacterium]
SFGDAAQAQQIGNTSSFDSNSDIRAADMNKDGLVDIVYILPGLDLLAVSYQQADGAFIDSTYSFGSAFSPNKIELADFNNDEWMDIVIGTGNTFQVAIYYNDQAGDFVDNYFNSGFPESIFLPTNVETLGVHQLLDVPYPTIAVLGTDHNTYLLSLDETIGTYSVQDTIFGGEGAAGLAFADFNGDGISEMVIGDDGVEGGNYSVYFRNETTGKFQLEGSTGNVPSGYGKDIFIVDIENDGKMEVGAVGLPDDASFTLFFYNDGTSKLEELETHSVPSGKAIRDIHVDNIGGKNGADIVAFTQDGNGLDQEIVIFPSDGSGTFETPITIPAGGMVTTAADIFDVSGNGLPDLIVRGDSTYGNRIWFNALPIGAPNTQPNSLFLDNSIIGQISIDFIAADDAESYLVLRRDPGTAPTGPTDGVQYPLDSVWSDQTVISSGSATSVIDDDVQDNTEYAYDIFAYNNSGTNTAYNSINPLSGNVFTSYDTLAVDSAVLRAIYAALDGPNWSTRTGWGNDPVKDWYGVEVNDGRVTRLDLSDNNLSGTLPDSIAYFAGLEYLDLSGNDLGGSLSEGIGNNELLDTLILRNSQLDGPLPDTIAALPNLTYLDAGGNEFHELPIDWSKSPLEDVRLDSNQLDFGNLEHLLILPLSNFAYSGQDHSEFAGDSLACLDSAILVGNLLEPSADDTYTWLFNGENMTDQTGQDLYIDPLGIEDAGTYQLVVSNSTLTDDTIEYGPFGLYVSTYKSDSVYLDALYDSLGGTGWANAANWTNTDMHDWEGVVATDTGVVAVNLAGQGLVGNLATVEFLSEMARLERLSLADNSLDGPIPYAWEHFASLRALDLSSNNIDYIEAHLDSVSTLDTVYIDDNHLDFDDLFSVEIVGKFDSLSYAPQKALGNTSTNTTETAFYSYSLGTDMVDASTNPTYTWYQDGNQIASADSLYNFELEELSLDNSGSYTVEITATYAPDLTLTDGPFHLLVSSLYEDSVKLTQLYNDWGAGADWTNSTNWNTGTRYDLDTWHGVTTNDTSVVELDLSANGIEDFFVGPEIGYLEGLEKLNLSYNAFQGHFPDEILRLNYLTELNLGNNFFISVPRLDSIESLENVDLGYNLIQFPDLEPLMNQFTNFVVPAMQFWEEQATYTLEAGESIDLSGYPDDGSANTSYQWMFNGSPLPGGTSAVLSLTNVGAEQSGYYILEATNSVVNLLNMSMDTLFIEVSSLAADSQRLADLYSALDGDNWADNTGWNNDTDLNNWFGVKVENNQVVEINLKGNGLTGNLPFNLGEFPGLEILDLSDNQISGDIPGEITNLDNLTDLDLSNNEFVSVTRLDTMASLVNASLKDNFLTFPDLEPLLTAGLTLDVSSMKSWGDANTFNLNVGDDLFLTGYANDGSANTSYQWYLEGAALADQTSADLNISQIETTNSGYYYMEATNSVVTGLTMTIDSILVNVNGLEEDSLRLLQIYDALDGDNWTNNTNWKVDGTTVDTWYGVKVENGLITRLELSNNNLTGEYPQAVRELSGIVFLDLSDNNIFGGVDNPFNWGQIQHVNLGNNDLNYSDSLTLDGLTYLNLSGNQMEFASLQRNLHLDTLIYAPQQPLPDEGDSLLDVGASLSFTINPQSIGGTTQWLWLKDGDTLSSVTDSTLSIDSVLKQNEGDYQVFVRNSLLPELVLETGILGLDVSTLKNDSLALVAIYDTLDGANWNDNSGWKNDLDLNTWAGVTVENYSVTSVDLNNNGLSGSLPVSVPLMSELRFLDLSSNEIEGSMPQGWRRFQKLQTLYLDNNRISEIPDLTQNDSLTELDVTYNQLNFDEIEPLVGFAGGSYTPQGPLTEAVDTLVDVGDAFNFTFAVPGADAIQWYKDGVALPNQTSPTLTIGSAQFEFDGVYIGEATSTAVPGLTLATDSIFLAVSSLERDSALIRTLYLATNGDNWTTQPNWNSEDIRDGNWDFITIENNRVTEINIPNNNLVGFVPRRITDMRFLKTLSLPTNQIFLIPDLTGMENLENVNMSQNRLQFGSIEPNVGLTNFTYSLQGQVGMAKDTVVQQGSPVTFSIVTTGENNTYQWFLNGTAISGATSDSLTIDSVSYDDMGFYTLEINNTQVDDLTLRSANQRVLAYASAGGQVNSAQGPIEDGRMYLFRVQRGRYDTLGPELLATDGLFQFDSVILGDFVMIAAPNKQTYPDGLRTWYGDVLFWQQADTINLRQDEDSLNIDLLGIPEPLDGDFSIAGTVFEDIADSTGRIERQRRVSGATVTVSREINIGRVLETEFEVVAITETDLDGNFEFNFLPANTYRIDIQFPGVPMDSTTSLDITVGATETDSVVNVTALVEEEGIAVSIDEVDGLWNPKAFPIVMYPNPSSGHINLSLGGRRTTAVRIHVLDLNGKELYQAESRVGSSRSTQFNLDHIPPGMYFLMVEDLDHERVQTLQLRLK